MSAIDNTNTSMTHDAIRRDQAQFARNVDGPARTGAPVKKFVAKGHDAQLQEAQFGKRDVVIILASGAKLEGNITRRDKWTVTLHEHDCQDVVIIYKHAIETILIKRPKVESETH